MKAFIYLGGGVYPENITEHPKPGDLSIAADSGYHNAIKLGERVDIIVGDMDSLGNANPPKETEIINFPPEKDLTDAQLAVETAIARGADEVILIGGLDGRLDHTLSVLAILEDMSTRGIRALVLNGLDRVRFIDSTSTLIPRSGYEYLSIIARDAKIKGLSIEGCKYPLKNDKLTRRLQFAISNIIEGNCALISVRRGGIFIVESRSR